VTDLRPDALRPAQAVDEAAKRGWTLTVLDLDAAYKGHLAAGELWLPFCEPCGRYLPAWISRCADHWDSPMTIAPVTGGFRLWSWVAYHRSYALPVDVSAPYVVAAVNVDNGPRINGFVQQPSAELERRGRGAAMRMDVAATSTLGTPVLEFVDAEESS
jgi:uncharacterized OB-fold protein